MIIPTRTLAILGDSQAAVAYKVAKSAGLPVRDLSKSGAGSDTVLSILQNAEIKTPTDILVFTGGNDVGSKQIINGVTLHGRPAQYAEILETAKQKVAEFGGSVYVILPPPAVKIVDLAKARAVFGNKVTNENYWIDSGYADKRNLVIEQYKRIANGTSELRAVVDLRGPAASSVAAASSGKAAPSVPVPWSLDGIHIAPDAATVALSMALSRSASIFPIVVSALALLALATIYVARRNT
jgi:hypothetical protein